MQPLSADVLTKAASTFVLGLVVGGVGTAMHRSVQPWGLVLCLLLVACAGFLARSWGGGVALAGLAGGMFLSVTTLSRSGPGGDVLVPAQQGIGWAWVVGAVGVLLLVAVAPRAMFRDEPRGERPSRVAADVDSSTATTATTATATTATTATATTATAATVSAVAGGQSDAAGDEPAGVDERLRAAAPARDADGAGTDDATGDTDGSPDAGPGPGATR